TMRLADGDILPGASLPFGHEGLVEVLVELARRIVRDVEDLGDLRRAIAGRLARRPAAAGRREGNRCGKGEGSECTKSHDEQSPENQKLICERKASVFSVGRAEPSSNDVRS